MVFAYVTDLSNLPRYMDEMGEGDTSDGETIAVTAAVEIPGRGKQTAHSDARFLVDREGLRIAW